MIIKAANNRVFKRKHDGFIMSNEIVLGVDYSTGKARQDKPEYYEEVLDPDAPTPPTPTGYGVEIPEKFLWAFPENKFILEGTGFEIPIKNNLVDVAYLEWDAFLDEINKPEHRTIYRMLEGLWLMLEEKVKNNEIVEI